MEEGNTVINAILGAVASVILSGFVPFAPVLGGGISGYLEGGDRGDGIRVGAISGLIALIPAVLLGFVMMVLFGSFMFGMGGPRSMPLAGGLFIVVAFVFGAIYFVGLSALGGWLGNYVKYDTNIGN